METASDPPRAGDPAGSARASGRLDAETVADLFAEIGPEVYRFLLGMLRDSHQAQDALQATFAKAVERGHDARPDSLRGWLFRVAFREAIDQRRRGGRQRRLVRGLGWLRESADPGATRPTDPVVRAERIEAVRDALAGLPAAYLDVVNARIFEEKTFAQIAEERGLPLGTVLTRMRRALDRLSRRLRDEDEP
ncbi:RNA polymerase sigma factor [Tautonia plasticadhaerens]|uniref:ECF RNA polymerase sigma factor SigW n=1 Tax=Tautonia plasticadhaerens TaxID=2527974 RepID=A0A518H938_9BACT|nr:RNA polymerase sigma factor [Tautonia plasticadhaerens]QDV37360.1 ECF RNA polymerase sigma factor SigW [Tautonia plasticadhaerens]